MSASISIIKMGDKLVFAFLGNENEMAEALTSAAFRNEKLSGAVTHAAIEIELKRSLDETLIKMITGDANKRA